MADSKVRVIDVNVGIFEENDRIAGEVRAANKANGTFMVNVMASPGAGKTTTLLRTIDALKGRYSMGVMEADIEASVDAEKMAAAGVRSMQIHTGGECAMDASMTQAALSEFEILGVGRRPKREAETYVLHRRGQAIAVLWRQDLRRRSHVDPLRGINARCIAVASKRLCLHCPRHNERRNEHQKG